MSDLPEIVALPCASDTPLARIVMALSPEPYVQCQQPASEPVGKYQREYRRRYQDQGLDPQRCARNARYQLGEHRLCAQHAGGLLLDLALAMTFQAEQRA